MSGAVNASACSHRGRSGARLTAKMKRFVAELVITRNGSEAARRAGYSARTARQIAAENLTKPAIQAAIAEAEAELAITLEIDRAAVIGGIFQAIAQARLQGEPSQVIRGWVEVARITGLDKPDAVPRRAPSTKGKALMAKFEAMSDEELIALSRSPAP